MAFFALFVLGSGSSLANLLLLRVPVEPEAAVVDLAAADFFLAGVVAFFFLDAAAVVVAFLGLAVVVEAFFALALDLAGCFFEEEALAEDLLFNLREPEWAKFINE